MKRYINLFGFYCSLTAFLAAVGYGIAQILQVSRIISYPLDEILIYSFSLSIAVPFLLAMLALHYSVPEFGQRTPMS